MAEVIVRDGTWTFDSELVRIVPGRDRKVHKLPQAVGELTIPQDAIAGFFYEPVRKAGRLRLRLRGGADPFLQATGASSATTHQSPLHVAMTMSTSYWAILSSAVTIGISSICACATSRRSNGSE